MVEFVSIAIYGILGLLALIVLNELGYVSFHRKGYEDVPLRAEKIKCLFASGQIISMEKHFLVNGQDFWKFKGLKHALPLTFNIDIWFKSRFPRNGELLYECNLGLDGQQLYYSGQRLSKEKFVELKEKERQENALKEDEKRPNTSLEKTVSEAMDEDYAENVFMEKVKIAEAKRLKTKTVKQNRKEIEGDKKSE